jgi:hypothetical protein
VLQLCVGSAFPNMCVCVCERECAVWLAVGAFKGEAQRSCPTAPRVRTVSARALCHAPHMLLPLHHRTHAIHRVLLQRRLLQWLLQWLLLLLLLPPVLLPL